MMNRENSPKMHLSGKYNQMAKSQTRQPIKLSLLKTSYSIFFKEFCYAHFGVKLG